MSMTINATITIRVTLPKLINEQALFETYDGDLLGCAKDQIEENGLCGVVEGDFEVVAAKRIPATRPLTCESCMKFQGTCSRVLIDYPCFQYEEEEDIWKNNN